MSEQTTEIAPATIDAAHLANQREWSGRTFGPGTRLLGVLDHIRKELREIEASPGDVEEWVDVIILAFDGAWRAGWEPQQIIDAIKAKQAKNESRTWPDWRAASPNAAIEHVRLDDHDRWAENCRHRTSGWVSGSHACKPCNTPEQAEHRPNGCCDYHRHIADGCCNCERDNTPGVRADSKADS